MSFIIHILVSALDQEKIKNKEEKKRKKIDNMKYNVQICWKNFLPDSTEYLKRWISFSYLDCIFV